MIFWVDWGLTGDDLEVRVMMVITYCLVYHTGLAVLMLVPHYDEYFVDGDMDLWQSMLEDTNA